MRSGAGGASAWRGSRSNASDLSLVSVADKASPQAVGWSPVACRAPHPRLSPRPLHQVERCCTCNRKSAASIVAPPAAPTACATADSRSVSTTPNLRCALRQICATAPSLRSLWPNRARQVREKTADSLRSASGSAVALGRYALPLNDGGPAARQGKPERNEHVQET